VTYSLLPWARRIEAALDSEFPAGTSLRINLDALARADSSVRVAYYEKGLSDGWLTVDEVRVMEGLPPMEEEPKPKVDTDQVQAIAQAVAAADSRQDDEQDIPNPEEVPSGA
jgi:phage portal protein BeeE